MPIVRYADPIDAFVERQQDLWLQRQQQLVQAGAIISGGETRRPTFTRARILEELRQRPPHHSQQAPPAQTSSAASSPARDDGGRPSDSSRSSISILAPAPIVFRGAAALPESLGISPEACADVQRALSSMTAAVVQSIFEPPSLHLLQLLCPWEVGPANAPPPRSAASAPGGGMEGGSGHAAPVLPVDMGAPVLNAASVHHSSGSAAAQSSPREACIG